VLKEADLVPAGIGKRLTALASEAEDMLLVYYAGHGLIGGNGELFLALPGTHGGLPGFLMPGHQLPGCHPCDQEEDEPKAHDR
jgi:hypothetical protein